MHTVTFKTSAKSEVRGRNWHLVSTPVNRESDFDFDFDFDSFVRACVRAGGRGEAKLCGRVRCCCFRGWVSAAEFVLRRGVWPPLAVRWVGVSQSSLMVFDESLFFRDKGW